MANILQQYLNIITLYMGIDAHKRNNLMMRLMYVIETKDNIDQLKLKQLKMECLIFIKKHFIKE